MDNGLRRPRRNRNEHQPVEQQSPGVWHDDASPCGFLPPLWNLCLSGEEARLRLREDDALAPDMVSRLEGAFESLWREVVQLVVAVLASAFRRNVTKKEGGHE